LGEAYDLKRKIARNRKEKEKGKLTIYWGSCGGFFMWLFFYKPSKQK